MVSLLDKEKLWGVFETDVVVASPLEMKPFTLSDERPVGPIPVADWTVGKFNNYALALGVPGVEGLEEKETLVENGYNGHKSRGPQKCDLFRWFASPHCS